MQLTLQITAGPHAGRKVLLRSGQIARIGRTEWADFSFPRDADLAGAQELGVDRLLGRHFRLGFVYILQLAHGRLEICQKGLHHNDRYAEKYWPEARFPRFREACRNRETGVRNPDS